ncbi:MAG: hypothetical protein Q8S57_08685 [Methanoregula sp.]|nr:hypothetical protein [Methanoregula sp.]
MRKLAILAIFLALTVLVSGCTQSLTPYTTTPPHAQGNEALYKATAEKITAESAQAELYIKNFNSKLASAKPEDITATLTSASTDLQDAKHHVQNAQALSHDLSGYATNAQEQAEAQKMLTNLHNLENAISSLNSAIDELQKSSPDMTVFEAKIKESSDWIAKIK